MTLAEIDEQITHIKANYPTAWVAISPLFNYLYLCFVRYAPDKVFMDSLKGSPLEEKPIEVHEQMK